MSLKRSEVFENFAKTAIEQGLITVEAEAMTEEDKHRNSDWKDAIRALYGIDPDGKKEDIIEKAHPKPAVVSPSYDKLNGLVENQNEQHDIIVGIVNKPVDGILRNRKYAEVRSELVNELVRLGFMLDNKNIDDLRTLADSCSERLVKKALPIGLIGIGVSAILGLAAIINNTSPSDQGIIANIDRSIKWVQEATESVPQLRGDLHQLVKDLITLKSVTQEYMSLGNVDISTPEKFLNAANTANDKFEIVKKYKRACQVMAGRLSNYIDLLKNFKPQSSSWGDWADKLIDVYRYFDPDDTREATLALETLQKSLIDSVKEAVYFMNKAKEKEPSLMAVLEKKVNDPDEPKKEQTFQASEKPGVKPDSEDSILSKELWAL